MVLVSYKLETDWVIRQSSHHFRLSEDSSKIGSLAKILTIFFGNSEDILDQVSFMPNEWGTSWKMRKIYKLSVQFSNQNFILTLTIRKCINFKPSEMTNSMTACQVSTLCSSSMNFEKSTSYHNRFKLVSKQGTAPLTAHNFCWVYLYIYLMRWVLGTP